MANNCKFQKSQYQVSYDSGVSWQNVVPEQIRKGNLIEYDSVDCTSIDTVERWRQIYGQYLCDGHRKYSKEILEVSYDGGITWYSSYPTTYRKGYDMGIDMNYCNEKFVGHYIYTGESDHRCGWGAVWNGIRCDDGRHLRTDPLKVVKCNDSANLERGETEYYTSGYLLTACTIGDCVSAITYQLGTSADGAFSGCTGLTSIGPIGSGASVEIPDSVKRINLGSFLNCTSLTSVTFSDGITHIGNQSFYNCSGLTSLTIPENVTFIGPWAFNGCTHLTGITVEAMTPPTLAGSPSSDITTLPFYNTNNCPIYVPCESVNAYKTATNWSNYANRITCIQPVFNGKWLATYSTGTTSAECDSSSAITSGEVTTTDLVSVEIGSCVTGISNSAFTSATTLSSVTIPNGVTSIGDRAFYVCSGLTSVAIPDSVTSIGVSAFYWCSGLTSVTIGSGVTSIGNYAFGNCRSLTSVTIPDSVTNIANSLFYYCQNLTSINIPSGVTSIGNSAFDGCSGLTSVTIPNGVTSIDYQAFRNCTSLSSVTIPDSVTSIGNYAFNGCSSLSSLTIGSGVTTIGGSVFRYCSGLTGVTVNATTPPALGNYAFDSTNNCIIYVPCSSVADYKAASGWSNYADRIEGIPPCGEPASFKWLATYTGGTTSSAECDATSAITQNEIADIDLVSVEIGDCVYQISSDAFRFYTGLTSINIPDNVAFIGNESFYYCTGLTSVTIGNGVTSIGSDAFRYCNHLTSVTVNATTPPTLVSSTAFSSTNNCPIYVPAASVNAYKSASGWSTYASRIYPIS